MTQANYSRLSKFDKIANDFEKMLYLFWGPMFIFCMSSLFTVNLFSSAQIKILREDGGFIIGLLSAILLLTILRLNIFVILSHIKLRYIVVFIVVAFFYPLLMSNFAADVIFTTDKAFYKATDVERFQLKRKGYIFLPQIDNVVHNVLDTIKEDYQFNNYAIVPRKMQDTITKLSLVEVEFTPQFIRVRQKKSFDIPKTHE